MEIQNEKYTKVIYVTHKHVYTHAYTLRTNGCSLISPKTYPIIKCMKSRHERVTFKQSVAKLGPIVHFTLRVKFLKVSMKVQKW